MADIPHLKMPFRLLAGAPSPVVEQDSPDEILDAAENILRYPQGHRPELPDFGVADQTFRQGGPDLAALEQAVLRWEPRAQAVATQQVEALVARVTVELRARTGG